MQVLKQLCDFCFVISLVLSVWLLLIQYCRQALESNEAANTVEEFANELQSAFISKEVENAVGPSPVVDKRQCSMRS